MLSPKLINIFEIISNNFAQKNIPFALIGSFALSLYGISRYTSDLDILIEGIFSEQVHAIMKKLGYFCFQKTDSFAQFDSEMRILGNIDIMFVNTEAGKDILKRSIIIQDKILGKSNVIQPTDYIILKMMAIANNVERLLMDEADIAAVIKSFENHLILDDFEPLNSKRILYFADLFRQTKLIQKYF